MDEKQEARMHFDEHVDLLLDVSHKIHAHPEIAYEERKACSWLSRALDRAGLEVETGVAGIPTAFSARAGSGSFHVALCAEYDALPEIGHACGHNIIGAASVGAGIALAAVADALDLSVHVIGTPAEELGDGGGKILLLEAGVFADAHVAMMVHPGPLDVAVPAMLACSTFDVHYKGVEAHASAFPERGVNALDAMTIAQTSIGLLRQHLGSGERVHGIVTHGGDAPNVVPGRTEARYIVRAPTLEGLEVLKGKVLRCFEAGGLASGATMEIGGGDKPYAELISDAHLAACYRENAEGLGREFLDLGELIKRGAASTDMGNVSSAVPTIHPIIGIDSLPAVPHQPEFASFCATPVADRALCDGALAMVGTAIDIARDPERRAQYMARPNPRSSAANVPF